MVLLCECLVYNRNFSSHQNIWRQTYLCNITLAFMALWKAFLVKINDTVKPLYNDIRCNDKTHYNDNLNGTIP